MLKLKKKARHRAASGSATLLQCSGRLAAPPHCSSAPWDEWVFLLYNSINFKLGGSCTVENVRRILLYTVTDDATAKLNVTKLFSQLEGNGRKY